jgi:predicted adenylyl cyclase CyaB
VDGPDSARRNVELKAKNPDPERSLEVCRDLDAEDRGVISQRDTYFKVSSGGLKLREESPGGPHLIQFQRASQAQQRPSSYRIVAIEDGATLRAALRESLGERGVVVKRRHLFLWHNVRIHLDDVEGLGSFLEFEAVAPADSDLEHEYESVAELRAAFSITDELLCAHGYADQLLSG